VDQEVVAAGKDLPAGWRRILEPGSSRDPTASSLWPLSSGASRGRKHLRLVERSTSM
jgi:hypothetical protein